MSSSIRKGVVVNLPPPVPDCIIELSNILFFKGLSQLDIIVQWRRRIRSVPVMELPQGRFGGDCLCTNSVISFSTERPDLGNWRSASGRAPKEPQYWWYDYIGSVETWEHCLLL